MSRRDYLIIGIIICAVVGFFIVVFTGSAQSNQINELRKKACHPYAVLSHYSVYNQHFVVCGDKTKEITYE